MFILRKNSLGSSKKLSPFSLFIFPFLSIFISACSYPFLGSKKQSNTLNLGMGIHVEGKSNNYIIERTPELLSPLRIEIKTKGLSNFDRLFVKKKKYINEQQSDSLKQKMFLVNVELLEINKILASYSRMKQRASLPGGIIIRNTFLVPETAIFQLKNIQHSFLTKNAFGYTVIEVVDHYNNKNEISLNNWLRVNEEARYWCSIPKQGFFKLSKRPKRCRNKINRKKTIQALIR